jgi:hypothetical protein
MDVVPLAGGGDAGRRPDGSRTSTSLQAVVKPAVIDRYSNSFLKIYFPIPEGMENELARKVLI